MKSIFDLYLAAKLKIEQYERNVAALGFGITHYPHDQLYVHEGRKIPAIRDFDAETSKTESALDELKRAYTLKLFAGGEEAKELFAALVKELTVIVS